MSIKPLTCGGGGGVQWRIQTVTWNGVWKGVKLYDTIYVNYFQLYCCQWLGKENIICGGSDMNMARVIDRGTLNVSVIVWLGACGLEQD